MGKAFNGRFNLSRCHKMGGACCVSCLFGIFRLPSIFIPKIVSRLGQSVVGWRERRAIVSQKKISTKTSNQCEKRRKVLIWNLFHCNSAIICINTLSLSCDKRVVVHLRRGGANFRKWTRDKNESSSYYRHSILLGSTTNTLGSEESSCQPHKSCTSRIFGPSYSYGFRRVIASAIPSSKEAAALHQSPSSVIGVIIIA